jgi:nucleotide-binding universal stress UspA family protein
MLEHILVAVDGSPASRHAARFAFSLARQVKAKVTLLTVLPLPTVLPLGPMSGYAILSPGLSDEVKAQLLGKLDEIAAEAGGVDFERVLETGPIVDTIVEHAQKTAADLIVIGARGLGAGSRLMLGSVSDRVVHAAHCPVTVWR